MSLLPKVWTKWETWQKKGTEHARSKYIVTDKASICKLVDLIVNFKIWCPPSPVTGFPGYSASKESAGNARDPGSIPGLGSPLGKGIGYPYLYCWASLVAQTVKKQPAMWETWVQSLGWEDQLEKGMATHSHIFAWRIPMDRGTWWVAIQGITLQLVDYFVTLYSRKESDMTDQLSTEQQRLPSHR